MHLTPFVAIHMRAAIGALLTGPVAWWTRKGARPRPARIVAGGFTLLPGRYLGNRVFGQWLGLV